VVVFAIAVTLPSVSLSLLTDDRSDRTVRFAAGTAGIAR